MTSPRTGAAPTVASVAGDRRLGLEVLAGAGALARPVLAAHTSELRDPTPWLHGGELLMTTGLQLDGGAEGLAAYVDRLAAAGVACLAVGTGPALTHAVVPEAVVRAAERAGLPLLEVPESTPFLAVTETVFAQLAAAQYAEQVRALDAQRALTAAAVHPGGPAAVAAALAALTGTQVLVADRSGAVVAGSPELREDLLPDLDRLRAHGLHGSASSAAPGRDVRVQPLGARVLRGFLVCAGAAAPGPFERQLAAVAVGLLTLELERRHEAADADRARRADVARALLAGRLPDEAAADLLAQVGVRTTSLRVAVLRGAADDVQAAVEALTVAQPDLLLVPGPDGATVVLPGGPADWPVPAGVAVGLGAEVRPGAASRSARQAGRASLVAQERGGGVVDVLALASVRLLLAQVPDGAGAYADAVLGPVEQAGPRGDALLTSLRVFLERNGSWEEAAGLLGLHRHTLRQRMRRVEELTGRRLDAGHDRMELLLALAARDLQEEH